MKHHIKFILQKKYDFLWDLLMYGNLVERTKFQPTLKQLLNVKMFLS